MKTRGMAALGTIIAIASLLLLLVLIMAGLSVIPLRLATQHLWAVQARMTAQAALDQFRYDYLTATETGSAALDFSHPPHPPLDFEARYRDPVFTIPGNMDNSTVAITFDHSKPYYSTDNTVSEVPAAGFRDRGAGSTSVPSFSVDLVISATTPAGTFHYEGTLAQVWDYALFSLSGMTLDQNTNIIGNVGITAVDVSLLSAGTPDNQSINIGSGGDSSTDTTTIVDGDADVLFSRAQANAAGNAHTDLPDLVNLRFGGQLTGCKMKDLIPSGSALSNATTGGLNIVFPSPSTFTPGDFVAQSADAMRAWQDFTIDGTNLSNLGSATAAIPSLRFANNVDVQNTGAGLSTTGYKPPPIVTGPIGSSPSDINVLEHDVTLDGSISGQGRVYLHSSLTNYEPTFTIVPPPPRSRAKPTVTVNTPDAWSYTGAGLSLKDCVLYVDGDLDLVRGPPDKDGTKRPDFSIFGDNATLIVSGSLRVEQGQLQASDRGLVILADAISLESGGTYRGLVLARQELRIVPMDPTSPLKIQGSVFAKGSNIEIIRDREGDGDGTTTTSIQLVDNPLRISSTQIIYDSRYTKLLSSLGTLTLNAWRTLP